MNFSICPQCNMLFVSEEEFLAHTKVKCARKLTCYTCGKLFTRVQGLALHLTDVRHGETVCSICGYEGESQKDAEIHIGEDLFSYTQPEMVHPKQTELKLKKTQKLLFLIRFGCFLEVFGI